MQTRKLVMLAILLAISIVFNIVERVALNALTAAIPIPFFRLGLANIVVIIVLYSFSAKEAFMVLLLRIFFVGYIFGFPPTFFLSLSGGVVAFSAMFFAKKTTLFSIVGVSILGAFGHAVGQTPAAIWLVSTQEFITVLPVLTLFSIPTGIFTGLISLKVHAIFTSTQVLDYY